MAGSVVFFIRVAFIAAIDLAACATFSVMTVPAVSRAFCDKQINHILILIIT